MPVLGEAPIGGVGRPPQDPQFKRISSSEAAGGPVSASMQNAMALMAQRPGAGGAPGKPCWAGPGTEGKEGSGGFFRADRHCCASHLSLASSRSTPACPPRYPPAPSSTHTKPSRGGGSHPVLAPSWVFAQMPPLPGSRGERGPGGAFTHPFNKCFLQGAEVGRRQVMCVSVLCCWDTRVRSA